MKTFLIFFSGISLGVLSVFLWPSHSGERMEDTASVSQQAIAKMIDEEGTMHVPAYKAPLSSYMSEEAKQAFIDRQRNPLSYDLSDIAQARKMMDQNFYTPRVEQARAFYPVEIEEQFIAGVRTDSVIPAGGVAEKNKSRVLINLHGGGFFIGAGLGGILESVPIADRGGIKVISVDYRQGPEYQYPAASEDVEAVYRELLKTYKPKNIGIYGCSAGGMLTAQVTAWLASKALPKPGAIAIACAGADVVVGGDARYFVPPLVGEAPPPASPNPQPTGMPYLPDDLYDPLVSPAYSLETLEKFPPTLLVTGGRDGALSSTLFAHRQLVRAGVETELHVWDGMWHGFTNDVSVPEAKEAQQVMVDFFNKWLGDVEQKGEQVSMAHHQ